MEIKVTKITDEALMRKACEATMRGKKSNMTLDNIYRCKHSPIRTQIFYIELKDIPSFVSTHLVRHSIGVTHFVMSNRSDRGGEDNANRLTLINHSMFINAEALMNMGYKRLCGTASEETREVMQAIKEAVAVVDPYLPKYMVRECEHLNGICTELRCCGNLWKPAP